MEKHEFRSESKRLLDLMINSIYTNKDIFLRELISNASDASDKLYYRSLTDKTVNVEKEDLSIDIDYDLENRKLTITDHGCGMTKEELENNLGVIAKSGSLAFKENLSSEEKSNIIGQFGVGFYSAFMVANKIIVDTKSIDSDTSYTWESCGADGYTIEESNKSDIGTVITLFIKEDTEDEYFTKYLEEAELKHLIRKYSDYIAFPIKMLCTTYDKKDDDSEYSERREINVINSMVPLWKKDKNTIEDAEYTNFYMDKFGDFDSPLKVIHTSVEGMITYKALLFIPSHAPEDYYSQEYEKGLSLYTSGVLIMDKCSSLLPDYLSFVKGVVDTEDLSLNISREMLQETPALKSIAKNIESKIRKELETMQKEDREKYDSFFKTFGIQLKYGVYNNYGADRDKLRDLVMFYSSKEKKLITLKEYVTMMSEGQKEIYFAAGSNINKIDSLPQVDLIKEKGYDCLYLTDYVDEFCITALNDYDGVKFKNIESGDLDIESDEEKESIKKINEDNIDMLVSMKDLIKEVSEVKFTRKLKKHPVVLTTKGDISIEMQKVFDAMPNDFGIKAETVLEINEEHPISNKLRDLYKTDKEEFDKYTNILYNEARIIAGLPIENPTELSSLICDILSK